MPVRLQPALASLAIVPFFLSCGDFDAPSPRSGAFSPPDDLATLRQPVNPPCTVSVEGIGAVHIEDEYVAGVVACENGNASMEALKAQAVQARGYLYYVLSTGRTEIRNSQADQVFRCTYTTPGPRHFEAARATRGEYLRYDGQLTAPFYVAGAIPASADSGPTAEACQGPGGNDPTDTEKWVTYNQGLAGCDINMTPLGWIPGDGDCNRNPQNRGCASQNGQACLANRGWFYHEMFPYYYGDDIELSLAGGECGGASTAPPNYDAYCEGHSQDSYCVDPTSRVLCSGNIHTAVEDCLAGCLNGECLEPPEDDEPTFCEEKSVDGWYCAGPTIRVQCTAQSHSDTEVCSLGCEENECVEVAAPSDDPLDPADEEPPLDEEFDREPDDLSGRANRPPGYLITTSPGIQGGCAQTGGSPLPAHAALFLTLLGLLISFRKADRRHHRAPE